MHCLITFDLSFLIGAFLKGLSLNSRVLRIPSFHALTKAQPSTSFYLFNLDFLYLKRTLRHLVLWAFNAADCLCLISRSSRVKEYGSQYFAR